MTEYDYKKAAREACAQVAFEHYPYLGWDDLMFNNLADLVWAKEEVGRDIPELEKFQEVVGDSCLWKWHTEIQEQPAIVFFQTNCRLGHFPTMLFEQSLFAS